jgi:hypothetical protein
MVPQDFRFVEKPLEMCLHFHKPPRKRFSSSIPISPLLPTVQ